MDLDIKGKKVQYFTCDKGGLHTGEVLNYVCIDSKCEHKGLICSICLNLEHEKHKHMPFKIFLQQLSSSYGQAYSDEWNMESFLDKIERVQQGNLFQLKNSVQKLSQMLKDLEENLFNTYKQIKNKLISQSYLSKNAPIVIEQMLNGDYSEVDKMKIDCQQLIDSIILDKEQIKFSFEPEKVLKSFQVCEDNFAKEIESLNKNIEESFEKISKIMEKATQLNQINSSVSLNFVPTVAFQSANWVDVQNNLIKFKHRTESNYTHLYSTNTFDKEDKILFQFKLKNYSYHNPSHLWVGICLEKHKETNFWKTSGNQIDIMQKSQNWKSKWDVVGQFPGNISKEDTIYSLEFCVKDNYLKIWDSEQKSICTHPATTTLTTYYNQGDKYVIVLGAHKCDTHIEIM
ncbi:hypothetical protein PPERSA_05615 [Pseudocohnilembus persalinus]|uniref:Uncharacterized protein n=1 Tax=Pseudocohnilembus persalinus TaxID=266149 RepID=A0A0V0QG73_PSEPJ|nr:hypothetical protein PPERSA_05615 [Pseudocohnilembus persalinus]|eukprot:KRX01215.1 hypothetical protein PPERSA_05615 [Pseudocohnilembus persalinus]